ncbi:metalloregulator ArsR/SmtB family transcription factor [Bacillus thuringiensis]|nr:metalloregulator ArsR/SmtB family transcription factor [Bacillus thuringiensis]MED2759998.1 metalloregulator ArsR/SmtB family transcription factor [Bacillus thuringiensis]MED2769492.1 metalloregulator ArsR/SmtB family transcription factor [Bacillus thuringiensis]MED2777736.1 metalloregulator ArsR/SmtB family transcription factor [Bacillus thuringiensis]
MSKSFNMDLYDYERSANILKVLGHSIRLEIMHILLCKGPLNVSELWRAVELPQSTVSRHLNKLKSLKLVSYDRKRLEVFYRVDGPKVIKIIKTLGL